MITGFREVNSLPAPLKWQIKRFSNIHVQGQQRNIFIFSTPRSGSTWLKELVATQPRIKLIDEPFNMDHFAATSGPLPPSWEFLLPHPGRKAAIESYIDDLTHNRIGTGSPPPFDRFHRVLSRRIAFKILRCTDLMNWFEDRFDAQIVYLIRHPLATSVSRTEHTLTSLFLDNDLYCERYITRKQREFGRAVLEHGTELEQKALDWCLRNLPPLKFLVRSKWLCIHYEDLVAEPEVSVRRLAEELELPRQDKMLERVSAASSTIALSDAATQRHFAQSSCSDNCSYLLHKWRSKVSREEEKRAFDILHRYEIDTYAFGEDMPANRLSEGSSTPKTHTGSE